MFEIGPFSFVFSNGPKRIVCHEKISLAPFDFVVITGNSGSGKSTLLQILKGIIPEFISGKLEGEILYKKNPLSGSFFQDNLQKILFLFQNPFSQLIYPNVPEEFFFSMENFLFSKAEMDQQKTILDETFGLSKIWDKNSSELSNGECQKLVLASLLAIGPEVLLLDEPTAFLDSKSRQEFYQWLKKIKGTRMIVLVDHHLNEVKKLADKFIHVQQNGEIILSSLIEEKSTPPSLALVTVEKKSTTFFSLQVKNLSFSYESNDQTKPLLSNINLQAQSGEVIVIKGANGSGKSTLFKLIAGILPLSTRKKAITYKKDEQTLAIREIQKEVGFIFQNPETHFFYDSINEELSLANNSSFYQKSGKKILDIFLKDIDMTRSPFLLSEGEKRRLSILMTVFLNKSLLLYDEPTFGQDQDSIRAIEELVHYLKGEEKIQIIISHNDDFIAHVADQVYELIESSLVRRR